MLAPLIGANIVVWLAALAYLLAPKLSRGKPVLPWNLGVAVALVAGAFFVSCASYRFGRREQTRELAQKHYNAGIDEKQRGNLKEAERDFQQALTLQPGIPGAQEQLGEIARDSRAEQREQQKDTRVVPVPSQGGSSGKAARSSSTPPKPGTPGEKPKPAPHKPSPFEITRYTLHVSLDPLLHSLDATAIIRIRSRGDTLRSLDFSLDSQFSPLSAIVDGSPAQVRHVNDLLNLALAKRLEPGREAVVTIRYQRSAAGEELADGDLISTAGIFLRAEGRWYPATGELDFRAPVEVHARVPTGMTVVSIGALKNVVKEAKTTVYQWETTHVASMVSLAAGKYVCQTTRLGGSDGSAGTPVSCYTYPQHRKQGATFLKEAAAIARFYEKRFGPYPYEKLALVEIPVFPGGYGTTSFVMLIDKSFQEAKMDREFVAHEIAHQWWGNSVFPQGLGAAWLTEAFANYSAWMYDASRAGNPRVLQKRVARAEAAYFDAITRVGDQPIGETDPYQPVGAAEQIVYEKGAVVLHMLRHEVGDIAFQHILRKFADKYRFGKAKIADFQAIAELESGRKLDWFFQQWLGRPGGMQLKYTFETHPSTPENEVTITVTQAGIPYRAKLNLQLEVNQKVLTRQIDLTQATEAFRFSVPGRVNSILFDPDNVYLMRPPEWVVAQNP